MEYIYKMHRGDTKGFEVEISNNGELVQVDKMYFTVKDNDHTEDVIFQKSLENGIVVKDNKYYVVINPEDTDNLEYGRYVFDCEIIKDGVKKTIAKSILYITEETTFACNEV